MSAAQIESIIENYSLERFIEQKFIKDLDALDAFQPIDDATRNEIRQAIERELDIVVQNWKIFLEDLAEQIILTHAREYQQAIGEQSYFMIGQEQEDVEEQLADQMDPAVVEVAYQMILVHKQRVIARQPSELRLGVVEYYSSMKLGWQVGQTFDYCMVQGTWHEALDTVPEAVPSKVEMFQIIPSSLDGVALRYLFGVENLLLADPRNCRRSY
jgi:hypothetical protein